ncbi:MAG: hypothetical protein OEX82_09140 [Nitrosomonas sp.]|nr:hypothetical protein [Nitrosomonas sp.]
MDNYNWVCIRSVVVLDSYCNKGDCSSPAADRRLGCSRDYSRGNRHFAFYNDDVSGHNHNDVLRHSDDGVNDHAGDGLYPLQIQRGWQVPVATSV